MKKKLFFKFMVFAVIGSLVTMTSCKDYDDDISGLQNQIDQLATKSEMTAELSTLQSTIATAQSGATAAATKADEALTAANQALADAKEAKEAADAAGNAEEVEALATQVTELEGEIAGLLEEIDAINEQLDEIAGLEDRVNQLISDLQETSDAQFDAFKEEMNTLFASLKSDVDAAIAELGNEIVPITSMTLIPELVSTDGSLPIVDYSVLMTDCEYGIAPAKTLRFYVNPSNATTESIDVENLLVHHNAPMTRSTDAIGQSAEFVSLENGILTVIVSVDVNKLDATAGTIDQMLLEVPFVNGGSVKSDWVKVETTEFNSDDLALVSSPLATGQTWADKELSTTLSAAQALTYTAAPVVKLTYDGTLDLATVVKTMTNGTPWADFNVDDYGLTYTFDIQDANDVDLDLDNEYIDLAGSVVTSKVFEVDGENPEAKDRMPIVQVRLYANEGVEDDECLILEGFVVIDLVAPCLDLGALQIDNYWFSDYEYTYHNSTVPGGSAVFGYTTNINNAFVTEGGQLALPYEGYSYSYIFTEDQLEDIEIDEVEYVFSVSEDGLTLSVTADEVTED